MRAGALVSAVAAGFVSISAAMADDIREKSKTPGAQETASPPATSIAATAAEGARQEPNEPRKAAEAAKAPVKAGADASAPAAEKPARVSRAPAPPSLLVRIDLSAQRLNLSWDGARRESWPISSGREGYATPRGVFRPQWSSKMWYSRTYDNAPMPHAVFFNGGIAVHGTQSIGALGRPASHGCVRLAPAHAARLYELVHKHGYARTRIEVFGTPPASRVTKRPAPAPSRTAVKAPKAIASLAAAPKRSLGWAAPQRTPLLRRHPNGLVYLPPNSPLRGAPSFVHNGVVYHRVR
jgi:lipoprotein-anchoring transpeptidase ErfK/SrfK